MLYSLDRVVLKTFNPSFDFNIYFNVGFLIEADYFGRAVVNRSKSIHTNRNTKMERHSSSRKDQAAAFVVPRVWFS